MRKRYETRHIFMAIAFCLILLSPILVIFLPLILGDILYYKNEVWQVFLPSENYFVFAAGLGFVILAFLLLFFLDIHKKSLSLGAVCLLFAIASFYFASQSYQLLAEDHISFQKIFTRHSQTYSWDEVKEIERFIEKGGRHSTYTFTFQDGNTLQIAENHYFVAIKAKLKQKLEEQKIDYIQIREE